MDGALAVVVGALIGLGGAVVGAWAVIRVEALRGERERKELFAKEKRELYTTFLTRVDRAQEAIDAMRKTGAKKWTPAGRRWYAEAAASVDAVRQAKVAIRLVAPRLAEDAAAVTQALADVSRAAAAELEPETGREEAGGKVAADRLREAWARFAEHASSDLVG